MHELGGAVRAYFVVFTHVDGGCQRYNEWRDSVGVFGQEQDSVGGSSLAPA